MRRERRWRSVALVATGVALGVALAGTPAGAHVSSWAHNWKAHIKPKVLKQSVRVAQANKSGGTELTTADATQLTVSIKAPAKGFVWVQAEYNIGYGSGCVCSGWFLLRDNVSGALTPNYRTVQSMNGGLESSSMSWVFPVTKGVRSFDLLGKRAQGTSLLIDGQSMRAVFIPFNGAGGKTFAELATGGSATATG